MSKRPSLIGDFKVPSTTGTPEANGGTVATKTTASKGEAAMVKTSTYFSKAVHEKLREIAFTERKTINDLMMEGLDKMLAERAYPTTKELTANAKAS